MRHFDVQSVEIRAPYDRVFQYVADPKRLPEWTHAFKAVSGRRATLATPNGTVEIELGVKASRECGIVDWTLAFVDGSVARAFSRMIAPSSDRTIYSFVLLLPLVPLEQLEGELAQQSEILREELVTLRRRLESREG